MNTALNALHRWLRGLRPQPIVEKRRASRAPFTEEISVRTAAGTTFRGVGRDLSDSGLGAIVYADLNVGESVIVYFSRHQKAASQFLCRPACVRRRYGNLYGFEFQCRVSA